MARQIDLFDFPVQANDTGSTEFVTRTAQFGDGYAQVSGEGINSSKQSWAITYSGNKDSVKKVKKFLDDTQGYKSFAWRNPLGELGLYRASKYEVLPYSSDVFRLTATFEQSFAP